MNEKREDRQKQKALEAFSAFYDVVKSAARRERMPLGSCADTQLAETVSDRGGL